MKFVNSVREVLGGFQNLRFASEEDGTRKLWAYLTAPRKRRASYSISELSEGHAFYAYT